MRVNVRQRGVRELKNRRDGEQKTGREIEESKEQQHISDWVRGTV